MISFVTFLFGVLTLVLAILFSKSRRSSYLPPGPPTKPFIGNLSLDQTNILQSFRIFRKKYGDVFSLILGAKTVVVINGTHALKEFFVKNADQTSDRPDIFLFTEIARKIGIVGASGTLWKEQRTFVLNALREFGFGKRSIESRVLEETEVILESVKDKNGETFNIRTLLHVSISNIMCSIIFGKRFDHNDEKFLGLLKCMDENFANPAIVGLATFLPFLKYIPGDPFRIRKTITNASEVLGYLKELIAEHKDSYDDNHIRDLLDTYLQKMYNCKGETRIFTDPQLLRVLADLFVAGTETTATTLRWFFIFCIRNPEIQDKMREEINNLIGESRLPSMDDRHGLPFCEAVLHETLRLGNIVPFSLPHGLTNDMEFMGYKIPKDTVIYPNLDSVHNDPNVFLDPEKFNPSRFLDENGKLSGQDKIMPFSLGRRVCLGESLARMELFLIATALIQRFRFLPENDGELPGLQSQFGITNAPKPFSMRAIAVT